jgi:hypothetical protein
MGAFKLKRALRTVGRAARRPQKPRRSAAGEQPSRRTAWDVMEKVLEKGTGHTQAARVSQTRE